VDRIHIQRVSVRDGYDLWSESYDRTPNPVVALDHRVTLELLHVAPGEHVLDAGCGTGRNLPRLAALGARVCGCDFSAGMLRVARSRGAGAPLFQADLQRDLPVRGGVFDAVLCSLIGEHLDRLDVALREIHRVTRPGGRLVFSVYHPDLADAGKEANFRLGDVEYRLGAIRYHAGDYVEYARAAGFQAIECFEFRGDHRLVEQIPEAASLAGRRVILALRARKGE
jgi:SAM-dependent methyltransferase